MIVYIAFMGWRGDYEILGVYESKDMADLRSAEYNRETGYCAPSGNESYVVECTVIQPSPHPYPGCPDREISPAINPSGLGW